jgi:hypothetical protein
VHPLVVDGFLDGVTLRTIPPPSAGSGRGLSAVERGALAIVSRATTDGRRRAAS